MVIITTYRNKKQLTSAYLIANPNILKPLDNSRENHQSLTLKVLTISRLFTVIVSSTVFSFYFHTF